MDTQEEMEKNVAASEAAGSTDTSDTDPKNLSFGDVLEGLKAGCAYARAGWHGLGMFIRLQTPTDLSKMTRPYIYIVVPKGEGIDLIPWVASQTDLLSSDWYFVE